MGSYSVKDIDILVNKYLNNQCTQEEKQKLNELIISSDNERLFKEVIFSHLTEFSEDQPLEHAADFERIYNQLIHEIKHRETIESEKRLLHNTIKVSKVSRLILGSISIAAVFFISFFLGTIFDHNRDKTASEPSIAATYTEIIAPFGAKSVVKLADGSEIILNAGSSIKYPSDFNSHNRNIILNGEAYFKVAKNINLPLIVNAGNINIKATGTEFNVKAYSDELIIETTLIEGKVEISQNGNTGKDQILELAPNQKAIYAYESDQVTFEKIKEIEPLAVKPVKVSTENFLVSQKTDVDQVTAWTKNRLIIKSENLESLCIKLQRKYNVTFVFEDEEIKKYRFSGVLLDETLEQVMNVIKLTAPVKYILDEKTIKLFSNKEQVELYSKYNNNK